MKRSIQRPIPTNLARSLALVILLTALTPWSTAQRTAHAPASRPALPHFKSPTGNFARGQSARHSGFHHSPHTSLPFPFPNDFLIPDDLYSTGYPVASQPPIILLQATRALAGSSDYLAQPKYDHEPATPPQPLLIELQNGRYVRVSGAAANGEPLSLASDKKPAPASTAPTLPTAVLVFRDGHTEEVLDYAIANGVLYARGNYYTDGYWNKKINLATLNVAETLQANHERNVKFVLPSSPNEVITRP